MESNNAHELSALFPNIAAQMRGIMSSMYLAARQITSPECRNSPEDLEAGAARLDHTYYQMLHLIDNLSASACLLDEEPFRPRVCDIVEVARKICKKASGLAHMMGLKLKLRCPEGSHFCMLDPDAMSLLLHQLLSNAVKFTPEGGTITVEVRPEQGHIFLSVSDTGRGIDPEHLPYLFGHYLQRYRKDPPPHGLGLGLPLCQRIAEAHGGTILAKSAPGKGTTFTVSIPDRRPDTPMSLVGEFPAPDNGFDTTLLALSDTLPDEAFERRNSP